MKWIIAFVTLFLALLPPKAMAAPDCRFIKILSRLTLAQERLTAAPPPHIGIPDMVLILSEMNRLDAASVRWALRNDASPDTLNSISDFVARLTRLANEARLGNEHMVRLILNEPGAILSRAGAERILQEFDCPGLDASDTPTAGAAPTVGRASSPVSATPFNLKPGWAIAIFIASFGPLRLGAMIYRRFSSRRKRLNERFPASSIVELQVGKNRRPVTLQDISCRGVKFRHDNSLLLKRGQKITISLDSRQRDAIISWGNTHYCGVRFRKALPRATVVAYTASSSSSAPIAISTAARRLQGIETS